MSFLQESNSKFSTLSLHDLLEARDQFHIHLMHKANVVGTAIGKYLIRKKEPYPNKEQTGDKTKTRKSKGKRTLENSEVRLYSWPCILVFVSEWVDEDKFANRPNSINASEFIPKTIYLRDGRRVPVCVIEAPLVKRVAETTLPEDLRFPSSQIGGGYPVIARVQQTEHIASLGCLVTDGHLTYALTSRHVVGEPSEELYSVLGGERVSIGKSSPKQLRRAPFEEVYRGWVGKNVFVNLDVGLIEVDDVRQWTSQIYGVGQIGRLADLSTSNLTLDLIGCPVRAYGCASGALFGKISALFYRFKSVGGFEYVADFLIGSRTENPLATRPGDSGTVWVVETGDNRGLMPIATQWGGSVFGAGTSKQFPFALATNLSNVFQILDVDLVRDRNIASTNYWGPVGHYTIGSIACDLVEDPKLSRLMKANRNRVSFETSVINEETTKLDASGFVPLANVPDVVWKKTPFQNPGGRKPDDNPTHYADLDQLDTNGQNLFDLITQESDVTLQLFKDYYDGLGFNRNSQRGSLPFRVQQFYEAMCAFAENNQLPEFVCAAGILSHYVGDACQVLHGSYLNDGDPARPQQRTVKKRDGTTEEVTENYGAGVHSAYESKMLNEHVDEMMDRVIVLAGDSHGMTLIGDGRQAAYQTIELMRRTKDRIDPMAVVEAYMAAKNNGKRPADFLWGQFKDQTQEAIADGCQVLAMLWDSAWRKGDWRHTANNQLRAVPENTLKALYSRRDFLPSLALDNLEF
jgi:hypothetical protein